MSWYVDQRGRQVWIEREETAFTIDEPPEDLPTENLTYLASSSSKAVYAEHAIDEEESSRNSKKKAAQAGKQRGFVVRVDQEDNRASVTPHFQGVVGSLLQSGDVSRVDVDNSREGGGKKKKKAKDKKPDEAEEKEKEKEKEPALPLGANECRVETTARCQHFAHGTGWKVEVTSDDGHQRIFLFTAKKELSQAEWHRLLLERMEGSGTRVMLGRMLGDAPDGKDAGKGGASGPPKRDEAQRDEDEWLESMLGRCMVTKEKKKDAADGADASAPSGAAGADSSEKAEKPPPKKVVAPPWLRR